MARVTKKECWELLEDRLNTISETRLGQHVGSAKLAVAVLVQGGVDSDREFINGNLFNFYCTLAGLHSSPTRRLMLKTLDFLENGGNPGSFKQSVLEA